jgi:hypothetical protein
VVSVFEGERSSTTGHFDFSAYARAQQLKALAASSSAASSSRAVTPLQTKTLLSLTTKITCSAFHPSGQILAMASSEVRLVLVVCVMIDIVACLVGWLIGYKF